MILPAPRLLWILAALLAAALAASVYGAQALWFAAAHIPQKWVDGFAIRIRAS